MAGSKDRLKDRLSRYRQIKIGVVGSRRHSCGPRLTDLRGSGE